MVTESNGLRVLGDTQGCDNTIQDEMQLIVERLQPFIRYGTASIWGWNFNFIMQISPRGVEWLCNCIENQLWSVIYIYSDRETDDCLWCVLYIVRWTIISQTLLSWQNIKGTLSVWVLLVSTSFLALISKVMDQSGSNLV